MTIYVVVWSDEEMIFGETDVYRDEQRSVVDAIRDKLDLTHKDVRFEDYSYTPTHTVYRITAYNRESGDKEFLGLLVGVEP